MEEIWNNVSECISNAKEQEKTKSIMRERIRKMHTPVNLEEIIQSEQFERFYTMRWA